MHEAARRSSRRPALPTATTRHRGAGEGIRTLDIQLGRLSLYQLSYSRAQATSGDDDVARRPTTMIHARSNTEHATRRCNLCSGRDTRALRHDHAREPRTLFWRPRTARAPALRWVAHASERCASAVGTVGSLPSARGEPVRFSAGRVGRRARTDRREESASQALNGRRAGRTDGFEVERQRWSSMVVLDVPALLGPASVNISVAWLLVDRDRWRETCR